MSRYLPLVYQAFQIAMIASNLFTLPSKPLFGYVTALLSPSLALLVAGEDWSLFLVGTCLLLGYHHIILFILMHLYAW